MTPSRDEVIRLAREAGMDAMVGSVRDGKYEPKVNALKSSVPVEWLEEFAALVAAAEREKAAEICKTAAEEARQQFHALLEAGDEQSALCNAASAQLACFLADMVMANGDPKAIAEAFRTMEKKAQGGEL